MEEFKSWREGKPQIFVMMAESMVATAAELFFAMRALRSLKGLPRLSAPCSIDEWLKLYRDHRRLADVLGKDCGLDAADDPAASELFAEMRRIGSLAKSDPEAMKKEIAAEIQKDPAEFARVVVEVQEGMKKDHDARMKSSANSSFEFNEAAMIKWTSRPETQFFLRVWFPCYLEYRCYPVELLRHARDPESKPHDDDALEDLLRLDKSAIFEPRIAAKLHRAYHSDGRKGYRRIMKALAGRLKGETSRGKVKCALAGLISDWAIRFKCPMNETEIREVFDAYARAQGKLIDNDLPKSKETFAKSIQRQRSRWRDAQAERDLHGQKS